MTTPTDRPDVPRWVPYVGILLGSVAVAPFALETDLPSWPFWLRFPVGATTGLVMGYVARALWIINNRGNR